MLYFRFQTVETGKSRGVDEPERSGAAFRHLVFSRNARSWTYFPNSPHTGTGPKKVIQCFAEEETINFPQIIKKVISKFFLSASALQKLRLHHCRAYFNVKLMTI